MTKILISLCFLFLFSTFSLPQPLIPKYQIKTGKEFCYLSENRRRGAYMDDMSKIEKEHYKELDEETQELFWRLLSKRVGCKF